MSSRSGNNPTSHGASQSHKGKSIRYGSNADVNLNQLFHNAAEINLGGSAQDDGGGGMFSRKSKGRTGAAKPWAPTPSSTPKAWGKPDLMPKLGTIYHGGAGNPAVGAWQTQPAGRGIVKPPPANRAWENPHIAPSAYMATPAAVPVQEGWNWAASTGSSQPQVENFQGRGKNTGPKLGFLGMMMTMMFWLTAMKISQMMISIQMIVTKAMEPVSKTDISEFFFESLDKLTDDQVNEASRRWHCPICKKGPGTSKWYQGLPSLMAHARTEGANRVKLHREFAVVLDEELYRRGSSMIPSGESYGKWEGLKQTVRDHLIVWPPMVIIMNTRLEQDVNDKWIGMGNKEMRDYFSQYSAAKALHSYGPQGHRGLSLLIFEASAMGYREAERLHNHFSSEKTDRDAWNKPSRTLFYLGGKRQLYWFMASKEDLELFNQHSQGKSRLKYNMRSYLEMVDKPLKQMEVDNQKLKYWENKAEEEELSAKALKENYGRFLRTKKRWSTKRSFLKIKLIQSIILVKRRES